MSDTGAVTSDRVDRELLASVTEFLYLEARLLDEHDYDAWFALWNEAGVYHVPANGHGDNPDQEVSIIYDNQRRLGGRVYQLQTGYRYAQLPQSRTQHLISNIEIMEAEDEIVRIRSAYLIVEARFGHSRLWGGYALHDLAPADDGSFSILRKKIVFVDNDQPLNGMAFLP
jgi:3-phenylpropionate/cinnamic acid dioxygenase small subunit